MWAVLGDEGSVRTKKNCREGDPAATLDEVGVI